MFSASTPLAPTKESTYSSATQSEFNENWEIDGSAPHAAGGTLNAHKLKKLRPRRGDIKYADHDSEEE